MGCDIHGYAEVRTPQGWEKVDDIFVHPYYADIVKQQFTDEFYHYRNYHLFAVLADVRNGFLSDKPVIAEPRGLPADVSDDVRELSDWWGADGHSRSWLTLKEVLDFDWTQEVDTYGKRQPLIEILPELFFKNLLLLKRLVGSPEDARLVFWFDN